MSQHLLNLLRSRWHRCLGKTTREYQRLLYILAEYEAIDLRPGEVSKWRKRYLAIRGVRFGVPYYIGRGFWLLNGRRFSFGDRCSFGEFARIMDHGPINVGDDFIAATGLQINSGTHDPVTLESRAVPISIGNRVWCGANVTIIAGSTIGDDVVIGAGSLVRSAIPSESIAVGVPARVVRSFSRRDMPFIKWSETCSS